jgi:hypothetical protein
VIGPHLKELLGPDVGGMGFAAFQFHDAELLFFLSEGPGVPADRIWDRDRKARAEVDIFICCAKRRN